MRHAVWPYDGDFIDDDEPEETTMTRQQILNEYGEWLLAYLPLRRYFAEPWTDAEVQRAVERARRDANVAWAGDGR